MGYQIKFYTDETKTIVEKIISARTSNPQKANMKVQRLEAMGYHCRVSQRNYDTTKK